MAWNDRFKQASAAKKHGGQPRVDYANKDEIQKARGVDLPAYLAMRGLELKKEGYYYRTRLSNGELIRLDERQGYWLYSNNETGKGKGGDAIQLVQEMDKCSFIGAVKAINGALSEKQYTSTPPIKKAPETPKAILDEPKPSDIAIAKGRAYLHSRGISQETIEQAEHYSFLSYDTRHVLFCGYDTEGKTGLIACRETEGSGKFCRTDSKKYFAPILPGNPREAWIVEGGVSALAVMDYAKRRGIKPPTIIMNDGVNTRAYLDNPQVLDILNRAEKITIMGENETTQEKQVMTDAARNKTAEVIKTSTGKDAFIVYPDPEFKDVADQNKAELIQQGKQQKQQEIDDREI